jgi:hypothetical protein
MKQISYLLHIWLLSSSVRCRLPIEIRYLIATEHRSLDKTPQFHLFVEHI